MIKLNDIIELKIEKLTYGSKALGRFGKEKFVVFVKNAVVEDILKVKIITLNKHFANGEIVEIITPSPHRTKPFCPIFNACGSCQFQNYEYNYLTEQKQNILKEIFNNVIDENKILPIIKSSKIQQYRHKIQFPTRQTKNSKRILMGYFKENSHDITNIKYCPVQPEIMNEIAEFIRNNFKLDCYNEKTKKGFLKNVLARISSFDSSILLTFVINSTKLNNIQQQEINNFAEKLTKEFYCIKGIFINFNQDNSNKILGNKTVKILGDDFIYEKIGDKKYKIGSTGFFQVNPCGAKEIFDIVKNNIEENSVVLDAYCGVGAIGVYIGDKTKKTIFVEENNNAVSFIEENCEINNIKNFKIYEGDAKKHFINFKNENKNFDYIILDPPRSGCDKNGLISICELTKSIIYVSCNPQTLKRDVEILKEKGFGIQSIQGIDLFPYTYHIETVAILKR